MIWWDDDEEDKDVFLSSVNCLNWAEYEPKKNF